MSFKFINGDVTSNRSLIGANQLGNVLQLNAIRDYYRFKLLYDNVLSNMRNILISYSNTTNNNDITYINSLTENLNIINQLIIDIYNKEVYNNNDITSLTNFKYDSNLFDQYKESFYEVLQGMTLTIDKMQKNVELTNTNAELTISQNILNGTDTNLISDYIMQRNADILVFSATQEINLEFKLKPWYSEYLTIYGAPPDGKFQLDKLAEIVTNLINTQVITLNDFILDSSS